MDYKTITSETGQSGLSIINSQCPDLILLDIMLPGEDGYSILERLKASQETKNIPVIMVTAKEADLTRSAGWKQEPMIISQNLLE